MRIPFSVWVGLALAAFCGLLPDGSSPARAQDSEAPTNRVYVANGDTGDVSVIDATKNEVVATVPVGKLPNNLAVSPDGRRVYVANFGDDTVSVLDTTGDELMGEPVPLVVGAPISVGTSPAGVAVAPDGLFVYVTNFKSETVAVLDTSTGGTVRREDLKIALGHAPIGVAVRATDSRLYVTNNGSNSVSSFDRSKGTSYTQRVGLRPLGVAVHPTSGRVYVVNSGDNTVSVLDGVSDKVIGTLKVGKSPAGIAVLRRSGARAYVTNFGDSTISVIDIPARQLPNRVTDRVIRQVRAGQGPTGVAVNADDSRFYVTNFDEGTVSVFSTADDQEITSVTVGRGPNGIAFY